MSVAVVTDSTAFLPEGADALGVHVVPLQVQLGGRTATDGVDVTADDVVAALREKVRVSTSSPSPAEFAAAYRSALAAGADHVVSIHLAAAQVSGCAELWTNDLRLAAASHGLAVDIVAAGLPGEGRGR